MQKETGMYIEGDTTTQECDRMTRFMEVWYRCRRCGHQFKWP